MSIGKINTFIGELDEDELAVVKRELDAGNLAKLVSQKITERKEADWNKVCPVCHSPIEEGSMTLIFGPRDLRKKASFCATDCLEYFLQRVKSEKQSQLGNGDDRQEEDGELSHE